MLTRYRKFASAILSAAFGHAFALAALSALALLLFFYRVDERALWSSHEGRAGQNAQLMIDSGHWGMPTLYFGEADYQKPPLYYWIVACVATLRGGTVDEWSVRFPSALAAVVGVWVVYLAGSAMRRPATGVTAALILMCNVRYAWLARVGRIDMPLGIAVSIALLSFYAAYRRISAVQGAAPRRGWSWMFFAYLATAVAVLLKGPVGVVLVLLPVLAFFTWERRPVWPWQRGFAGLTRDFGVWWGVPLTLAIACPWFVWATATTHGAFFRAFFLHHHWDRTLGIEGLKPEPPWYYIPQLFADMFPWSLLIPAAVFWQFRRASAGADSFGRFACCWVAAMFGFLSLVRFKRHDYLLPLVPGISLLLAGHWERVFGDACSAWPRRRLVAFCSVWIAAVGSMGIALVVVAGGISGHADFGTIAARWFHEWDELLASELLRTIVPLRLPLFLCIAGALSVSAVAAWLAHQRRPMGSVSAIAVAWIALFLAYIHGVLPQLEPVREQRTIADALRRLQPEARQLYYYGREDQQLMFYLGPQARWLPDRTALWPIMARGEPIIVIMELDRFVQRQKDWPAVGLEPVLSNTSNCFGVHQNPAVIATNAAGKELVRSGSGSAAVQAN